MWRYILLWCERKPRRTTTTTTTMKKNEHSFHNAYTHMNWVDLTVPSSPNPCSYARRTHHTTPPIRTNTRTSVHTYTRTIRQTRSLCASNLNVKFKELTRAYCTLNKNHNNDNELLPKKNAHKHTSIQCTCTWFSSNFRCIFSMPICALHLLCRAIMWQCALSKMHRAVTNGFISHCNFHSLCKFLCCSNRPKSSSDKYWCHIWKYVKQTLQQQHQRFAIFKHTQPCAHTCRCGNGNTMIECWTLENDNVD